jgi:hypothetical protein
MRNGEMRGDGVRREDVRPGPLALWTPVLGPPVVSALHLAAGWALVLVACHAGSTLPQHAVSAAALVMTLGTAALAVRNWRRVRDLDPHREPTPGRARFLGFLGLLVSAFFTLVVLAMWLPVFLLSPCEGIG